MSLKSRSQTRPQSSQLHRDTLAAVAEMFPHCFIEQEKTVEVVDDAGAKHSLYFDIFVPDMGIAVECQGIQHFRFVERFHGDRYGFSRAQKNDEMKREWCRKENILLVEVRHDDKLSRGLMDKKIKLAIKEREKNVREDKRRNR